MIERHFMIPLACCLATMPSDNTIISIENVSYQLIEYSGQRVQMIRTHCVVDNLWSESSSPSSDVME